MWRRLCLPALLLALLAAACSDGGGGSSEASKVPASLAFGPTTTVAPESVLRIAVAGVDSLDPVRADPTNRSAMMALDLLFDGLTSTDPGSGVVEPALARSWSVTNDGRQWTFELDASTFGDGTAVGARDVVWSIERVLATTEPSLVPEPLSGIEGFDAFVAGQSDGLSGVRARDGAVVVRLRAPDGGLPAALASPLLGAVPRQVAGSEPASFGAVPTGSGPFTAVGRADGVVRLEPTERYRGALDAAELHLEDDEDTAFEALLAGSVALAPVPPERANEANHQVVAPYGATVFYGMNLAHPDLQPPSVMPLPSGKLVLRSDT